MAHRIEQHRRVYSVLESLTRDDRERVLAAIDRLRDWPDVASAPEVTKVDAPHEGDPLYVLRVAPSLRALFAVAADGTIVLRDVADQELLSRYFQQAAAG